MSNRVIPDREPDVILPKSESCNLGEIHVYVEEQIFVNITACINCFGPKIASKGNGYYPEEYLEYEANRSDSTPRRRKAASDYFADIILLEE